jgi:hypothetical protein
VSTRAKFIPLLVSLGCAAAVCLPSPCYAWHGAGHSYLTEAAIRELPAPLKTLFEKYQSRLKGISATEPPGKHYILIDLYPEFFTHTFPRDLDALIAEYGTNAVDGNGMGPWTAVSYYETLRALFAGAVTESDWTNLLSTAGALAHYLEDLHQPMHLTVNINGQRTGQDGVHYRYEGSMVGIRINAGLQLATNVADCIFYPSLLDAIFDDIDLVYPNNATLLAADLAAYAAAGERESTNYYQHFWDDGCSSFTPFLMQKAAGMAASAWYSAWREAGFPQPPNVPPSPVFRLSLLRVDTTGSRLSITGDAGQRLEVQTSTNGTTWSQVATLTNLTGRDEITVPPIPGGERLYRARLLP